MSSSAQDLIVHRAFGAHTQSPIFKICSLNQFFKLNLLHLFFALHLFLHTFQRFLEDILNYSLRSFDLSNNLSGTKSRLFQFNYVYVHILLLMTICFILILKIKLSFMKTKIKNFAFPHCVHRFFEDIQIFHLTSKMK